MFDVSGLTEVKMKKYKGWQGSYFLSSSGDCLAKTCGNCKTILSLDSFANDKSRPYGARSTCKSCVAGFPSQSYEVVSERTKNLIDQYRSRSEEDVKKYRDEHYPTGLKQCIDCKNSLPFSSFYKLSAKLDGLLSRCIPCYRDKFVLNTDETGELIVNVRGRVYSANSRERLRRRSPGEVKADMLSRHPEGTKTCRKCKEDLDISFFHRSICNYDGLATSCKSCKNLSDKQRSSGIFVEYWNSLGIPLECYICKGPWAHADHVVAEKLGGSDEPYNRLPICQPCNSSKWMHPLDEWIRKKHPDVAETILRKVAVTYGMVY